MKTKDLIKLLQKEDPTGELHVRIEGLSPWFCEKKPGYWDGPYQYIESDTLIFSTEGNKVDIHLISPETWVEMNPDDWQSKIRFDLYDSPINEQYKESVIERLKKSQE